VPPAIVDRLASLRGALQAQRKVHLEYTAADGSHTERVVRPIGLFFWGTAGRWRRVRAARGLPQLPLDRMRTVNVLDIRFQEERGARWMISSRAWGVTSFAAAETPGCGRVHLRNLPICALRQAGIIAAEIVGR